MFPFLLSVCDSIAYDPVKTRLSELEAEAEAEEPTNCKARNQALYSYRLMLLITTLTKKPALRPFLGGQLFRHL